MIGKLSHKVKIQEKSKSSDGAGGINFTWVDIADKADIFAKIDNIGANNKYVLGQEQFYISHKACIRYRDDIEIGQRLIKDNRNFDIKAVININEANRFLELLLLERV